MAISFKNQIMVKLTSTLAAQVRVIVQNKKMLKLKGQR
jgi:hypothetical protein